MGNIMMKFLEEMGDALSTDRKLTSCDRDMQLFNEIQKKRLRSKGLELDYDFMGRGFHEEGQEHANEWKDGHYVAKIWSASSYYTRVLKRKNKVLKKHKQTVSVWAMVLDYLNGERIDDDICVCPNCGNPAKVSELTEGCPYCGTMFKTEELYPKVINYNIVYDPSRKPKEFWKPTLIFTGIFTACIWLSIPIVAIVVTAIMVLVCVLLGTIGNVPVENMMNIVKGGLGIAAGYGAFVFFPAPFIGYVLSLIPTLARLGREGARSAALLATFNSHKMFEEEMKKYGQEYMDNHFMSQTVSKVKAAIYSDNPDDLPFYEGAALPQETKDIVDVFFRGAVDYKKVEVIDNIAHVDLDVYTEVLSENKGKAKNQDRIFHVRMKKNVNNRTALDFSVSKFMCPTCGKSFDAYKHKRCPSCNNVYKVEDADWVIESIV